MTKTYGEFDVIVAGGGTAGAVAGITAARHGLKTLVVEQLGFLGGSQTGALVTPMMDLLIDGKPEISAVNREIKMRLELLGEGRDNRFNPEALKFVLEQMFLEAGGNLLFFTHVIDVIKERHKIEGIIFHNKSGIQAAHSKVIIDCTGDADVAYMAGVPFESGKRNTGLNQPMSVRFEIANINVEMFSNFLKELGQKEGTEIDNLYGAHTLEQQWPLSPIFIKGIEQGIILEEDSKYFQFFAIPGKPKTLAFNCPEIINDINGTNADHLTLAMVKGRKAIIRLTNFMKRFFPGFEESYVSITAPMAGVRESRRIIGKYMLTAQDVAKCKKFDDGIAKCNYYMDIHNMTEEDKEKIKKLKNIDTKPEEKFFEVPFRCCVPEDIENILIAGRCVSADFEAQSALRIQQVCRALGEACGHAAYIAIRKNQSLWHVDGSEVRSLMSHCIRKI